MGAVSYRLTFASCNPRLNFTPKSRLADPAKATTVRFAPFSDAEGDMMFVSGTLSLGAILLSSTCRHKGRLNEGGHKKKKKQTLCQSYQLQVQFLNIC